METGNREIENRLRNLLVEQEQLIPAPSVDSDRPGQRLRTQKRQRSAVLAACSIPLLLAGFWAITQFGSEDRVETGPSAELDPPIETTPSGMTIGQTAATRSMEMARLGNTPTFTSSSGSMTSSSGEEIFYLLVENEGPDRPNLPREQRTIVDYEVHIFDDDGSTSHELSGRRLGHMVEHEGTLHVVSTGTADDAKVEIGTSIDEGASWDWQLVDVTDQFGDDASTWPAFTPFLEISDDGSLLLLIDSPDSVDEALAQEALLESDYADMFGKALIVGIEPDGVEWFPNMGGICSGFPTDGSDEVVTSDPQECPEGPDCPVAVVAPGESPTTVRPCKIGERLIQEAAGGGVQSSNFNTWDELGIQQLETTSGSTYAYSVTSDEVDQIGPIPVGQAGNLTQLAFGSDGFRATFDTTDRRAHNVAWPANFTDQTYETFVSDTGAQWRLLRDGKALPPGPLEVDGVSLSTRSTEDNRVWVLQRSDNNGPDLPIPVDELRIDGSHFNVVAGDGGFIVTATKFDEEFKVLESATFFTPDGMRWHALEPGLGTELFGQYPIPLEFIELTIVGEDEIVLLVSKRDSLARPKSYEAHFVTIADDAG